MKKNVKDDQWISVKYPPPLGQSVIVCRAGQRPSFEAKRIKVGKKQIWTNAVHGYKEEILGITHWMPMPDPKQEG